VVISDAQSKEGKSGATAFVFFVSLSGNPLAPVTVDFATAAGTAGAPSDFQDVSGTVTFAPGVNAKTVTVWVVGDRVREPDERFSVNLSNPSANAYIDRGEGVATIVNDD
jgi:hypothetical protein